ncbi:hypothetical protein LSH36_413g02071 [Paralvinella palmiformis]|uniref:BHLH domain-containing protein n=1 Tax=Paralvinella palmiformis TaxID=53620 RepID=A0AAD9JCR1_9ANNE|nr:hypothetical protein LSH36_413g02071 [Paralvinella palmiformis]
MRWLVLMRQVRRTPPLSTGTNDPEEGGACLDRQVSDWWLDTSMPFLVVCLHLVGGRFGLIALRSPINKRVSIRVPEAVNVTSGSLNVSSSRDQVLSLRGPASLECKQDKEPCREQISFPNEHPTSTKTDPNRRNRLQSCNTRPTSKQRSWSRREAAVRNVPNVEPGFVKLAAMGRRRKDQQASGSDEETDSKMRYGANARERDRMRVLSKAFGKLKTTLPWVPPDTKLSKLDTLRLATCYIAHLRQILSDENDPPTKPGQITCFNNNNNLSPIGSRRCGADPISGYGTGCDVSVMSSHLRGDSKQPKETGYIHPLNLTWPYSFSSKHNPNAGDAQKLLTSENGNNRLGDVTQMQMTTQPLS